MPSWSVLANSHPRGQTRLALIAMTFITCHAMC